MQLDIVKIAPVQNNRLKMMGSGGGGGNFTPQPPIQAYGRNRFAVANPAPFNPTNGVGHPNPFTLVGANWAQEVALLTDLQYNIGAQYLIKCGYNAFSQFATSHLSAPWIPLQNVDGSFNEFRPNAIPRGNNVAIGGNPWNISLGYDQICGIENDPQSCTTFNLDGSIMVPPGKRRLDASEAGTGRPSIPVRTATYVFEQATTTVDALSRKIRVACNGNPAEATYQVYGVTGQALVASNVLDLFTHLQTATPGIYSLRVFNQQTTTCSVLMLVVR